MISRISRIFINWGWLLLMTIFMIVILYFTATNQRLFRKSIIDNFNKQQFVLITTLGAVVENYFHEAEQNIRMVVTEIDKVGNPQKSREFISTVYLNHKDEFLAIAIYDSAGKLIENVPKDAGQTRSIPGIQMEIINYSGDGDQPFISARYLYEHQSIVGLILPFTLSGGERYFTVGILMIEDFLKLRFSSWENTNVCFILANHDGDLLSMLNVEHDDVEMMSEGNIRSLDETCLTCHKPDDFTDIVQSAELGNTISSVFHYAYGKIINRNTTLLTIYNDTWSWSICTPFETVQGAIDRNFFNIIAYSLVSLLVLGFIIFFVFRTQKKREILEVEAENLKKILETSSALAKSEDKFRRLFEESLDAVFITSREGEFIELNRSGLELFGYTLEEIMSIELKEIYANPENHKAFQQMIEKQGFVKDYELDFIRKDGTRIKCVLNASVIRDETGNINGCQGIIHDITKSKESEYAVKLVSELDRKRVIEVQESYDNLQESQKASMNLMEDLTREIEERKIIEENLRSAQEYSKNLIDSSLDMIIAVDVKRRITEFNQAAVEAFGYQKEEVLGKHINMLYADVKQGSKVYKITVEKGRHVQEISNQRKNGDIFPALLAASTLINSNGEIIGVMGVSRDITERKRAEDLKNSIYRISEAAQFDQELEELFKSIHHIVGELIHAKNFYIALYDPDSEMISFPYFVDEYDENPGHKKPGKGLTKYVIRTGRSLLASPEVYEELVKNGEVESIGAQSIDWLGVPLKTEDKTIGVIAVQSYTEDIRFGEEEKNILTFVSEQIAMTIERKRIEKEIISLARFPAENPNPILRIDLNGILLYANKPALSMRSDWDFQIGQIVPDVLQKLIKMTKIDASRNEDVPCGERIYSITSSLSPDAEYCDVYASDITDYKRAEKEREFALQDAQNANEVKNLFLANMSHEIRTPLNAILGFTDLLETSTSHLISEEEKGFFNTIKNSGKRLMHTIHEVLDISQIEAGSYDFTMEELDLCVIVPKIVNACKLVAENKSLKLSYTSNLESAFVIADQNGVTQSIGNIIDNAIRYTNKGTITVSLKQKANHYVLTIKDTGVGIAEEYVEKMFEAFSQESEGYTKKFQGIGLGMAITKRHLDMNQIDIDVESTKGVGTTVTLTFNPLKKHHRKKEVKEKKTEEKLKVESVEKPLVLVVEDDVNSQRLVEFFLKGKYDICTADSVNDAKDQIKKHQVELILLDLSLVGNEDGLDLVRWMRKSKAWKKIPVIATTAHAFTQDKENCIAAGCNDYLSKPITRQKLLGKIREYV